MGTEGGTGGWEPRGRQEDGNRGEDRRMDVGCECEMDMERIADGTMYPSLR